jgi:nucleolar protein 56
MASVNYILYDSAVGYGIFEVVHQADSVGVRLKEVQDSMSDLSKFGKMVKLVNFSPWRCVPTGGDGS